MTGFDILRVGYDHPDAHLLIARVQEFYAEQYGGPDDDPTSVEMFAAPAGAFFVGYDAGVPVATGAWRRHAAGPGAVATAEIKRMYVVPERTRQGLARQMLAHLEATAAAAGYEELVLSTGPMQPEAIALYRSAGYVDIAPFGYYGGAEFVDVVTFLGKPLADLSGLMRQA